MNWHYFADASWIIQVHVISAVSALAIGGLQLFGPKGTLPHRTLGYLFVALMISTASTAIFIRQINDGQFSLIHLFVPMTFLGLWGLVRGAMQRDRHRHAHAVRGLFFGALLIPGLFAFVPGRLMYAVFLGG